jgi:hypothetical protein
VTKAPDDEAGTLYFFRRRPAHGSALISSLQSIETSFFLTALHRHPHALTTLVSGVESALQAAATDQSKSDTLQTLIRNASAKSPRLRQLSDSDVDHLRLARNRFVHRGFSPKDDSEAVELFLTVGVPLAEATYSDLHAFHVREELLEEYAQLIDVATVVAERARSIAVTDLSYCLNAFAHLIRWRFQENFSTGWQLRALDHSEKIGARFAHVSKEREELERVFAASWALDCPICDAVGDGVCELDDDALSAGRLVPTRFACANCGFVVRKSEPFLGEVLFGPQLTESRKQILAEYGIA